MQNFKTESNATTVCENLNILEQYTVDIIQ